MLDKLIDNALAWVYFTWIEPRIAAGIEAYNNGVKPAPRQLAIEGYMKAELQQRQDERLDAADREFQWQF